MSQQKPNCVTALIAYNSSTTMQSKHTDYHSRLRVPVEGNPKFKLFTKTGVQVAKGFCRVVIGGRGPYVEMDDYQIMMVNLFVPKDQMHRVSNPQKYYYEEWRTNDAAYLKLYYQKATVDYADYRVGMWYATPFELYGEDGIVLIDPIKKSSLSANNEPSIFD